MRCLGPLNASSASPGCRGKLACRPGAEGSQTRDPPLNELLSPPPSLRQLARCKDVLLSKQPQSRTSQSPAGSAEGRGWEQSRRGGGVPLCPGGVDGLGAPPAMPPPRSTHVFRVKERACSPPSSRPFHGCLQSWEMTWHRSGPRHWSATLRWGRGQQATQTCWEHSPAGLQL